jgi:DNA-binding CsgD family transcriptional regulator
MSNHFSAAMAKLPSGDALEELADVFVFPSPSSVGPDAIGLPATQAPSGAAVESLLIGRHSECAVLNRLIADVRRAESRTLVVRGEAGIGKTALLEYLVAAASDLNVIRAVGVESEMELAYAGLHQLVASLLDRADRIPAPQREALETVFGLGAGPAPDRFLVGLAVLSLLAEVADDRPLLCVIDDAQWLDQASALTLAFVARRLLAEPIGLVFAAREPGDELRRLPELEVPGLRANDARSLLSSAVRFQLEEGVRDRIVAETRGNPLALLELPRGLTRMHLAGGFGGCPHTQTLSGQIEESFRLRLEALPGTTRILLLVAAADPLGDPLLLSRTADRLGVPMSAADDAEAEGLLAIDERVTFRHPLVRSAVYGAASPEQRREVHVALADVTDRRADPDRRAWHLAAGAAGPDEEVAMELERSATRARARGGPAAAAAFLQRSVALTVDLDRRVERALAASEASLFAGALDAALSMLSIAEAGSQDDLERARVELLRGQIAFAVNRGRDAPELLLAAAHRLERLDIGLARETYLEALSAGQFAGRLAGRGADVLAAARASLSAGAPNGAPRASDALLDGLATLIAEGYASGAPLVKQGLAVFGQADLPPDDAVRWTWLACRTAVDVWDFDAWELLSERTVSLARDEGALAQLPSGLTLRIGAHLLGGDLEAGALLLEEVEALTRATGTPVSHAGRVSLAAWRGREDEAKTLIDAMIGESSARGEGWGVTIAHWAGAVLSNGLGRYQEALASATLATEYPGDLAFRNWSLAELVEAAVRAGETASAADALDHLARSTGPSATDWALGVEARSRALLREGEAAEDLYREAISRLERSRVRVELARAHLLYGEWLRRERRRVDARAQLHAAYDLFTEMGMEAFAERARIELLATGEKVRKRTVETRDELTAQERQVARLAGEGLSNAEIGARLFISPRTVEWHLRKAYAKLGIRSRRELSQALGSLEPSPDGRGQAAARAPYRATAEADVPSSP